MAIEPTLEPTPRDMRNLGGNTTELDRSEESSTTSLYGAAVGNIGKKFYLPIFSRFEAADRGGISWNWAASLATLNWMAFRSLWSAALAYAGAGVGLALLIFGIGRLVFRFSETVEMALLAGFLAVMFIVPGVFANALLHADCRKRMARALAANTTLPEACAMLARQAPSRSRLITLVVVNLLMVGAAAGAYLNFPAAGSLPKDTLSGLATMDPLGTRAASSATAPTPAASAVSAPASAPVPAASAPAPAVSAPASAPAPTAAPTPAVVASAPVRAASASKPAATASAPKTIASVPSAPKLAASASTTAAPPPAAKASAATASASTKATNAASGRVAVGVVQVEPARKAPAPARTASAAEPAASSPQEVGKVYRSEPAPATDPVPAAVPVAIKPVASVAGKGASPAAATAAAKPKSINGATKANDKHLINVGLFAQETNAANAMAKLKEANLPAYSEAIRSPTKGKLTRVRVGPFTSQADAEAAMVKIRALGLDALPVGP